MKLHIPTQILDLRNHLHFGPLQYLTYNVGRAKNLPRKAELAWQVSRYHVTACFSLYAILLPYSINRIIGFVDFANISIQPSELPYILTKLR